MIKLIQARYLGDFQVELTFSDGAQGHFDGQALLKRQGPLLDDLRDEAYFGHLFIDAGTLAWPNGLELSPARIHETCGETCGMPMSA
ncbi:MAG: DUF2442 domain-containing protein [Gammaproteobacteria bacterium SHHR-1]|uniref:DUF2442 domain-containing protein n=1 Tax=Magnetovirga frankeli TaxID=947516 RepID=UPI0012933DAE|nr:DUF2442 domain-containing protein [gamma proteobacterium SS-5]